MINTPKDHELKLLDYARKAAVHAELVTTCERQLDVISHDGARNARKDILQAIDMLQAFEQLLSYRINEE
jgi:hypothetical protein